VLDGLIGSFTPENRFHFIGTSAALDIEKSKGVFSWRKKLGFGTVAHFLII